jgi:hypothetical protein
MSARAQRSYDWLLMMVGAHKAMPQERCEELQAWEHENIDGHFAGTADWPGWERILGKPFPGHDDAEGRPKPKASISAGLRTRVYERDQYRCRACGTWESLSVDHIVPESRGGPTALENLQTLCLPCNISKGTKLL